MKRRMVGAALALGDTTARDQGRLTLNPFRHIDRVGTIILPGLLLISQLLTDPPGGVHVRLGEAGAGVGLEIPQPQAYMAVVALAGPAMNFFLASVAGLALRGLANANPAEWLVTILFDFNSDQHGARTVQPVADSAARWRPGPRRACCPSNSPAPGQAWSVTDYSLLLVVILVLPNVFGIDPIGDVLNKTCRADRSLARRDP